MHELKHDIEKYLRGELSPAEMHALEKRAFDDPFLADALEGAGQVLPHEFASDMKGLQGELEARLGKQKVIPIWVWPMRIAAGLLLVAVSTYVIVSLTAKDDDVTAIAANEMEELRVATDSIAADSVKTSGEQGYLSMAKEEEPTLPSPVVSKPSAPKSTKIQSEVATNAPAERGDIAEGKASEAKADDTEIALLDVDRDKASPPVSQPPTPEKAEAKEDKTSERAKRKTDSQAVAGASAKPNADDERASGFVHLGKVVKGRVTSSDDGSGLPGVNVIIKGTSTGTVTDVNGNYQIILDDTQSTLVYSFIGLQSTEVPVNDNATLNVTMDQDVAQLSEVVVTGYGDSKNEEEKIYSTFEMAEPAGGRKAFKKYLEEKLVYPQQALENNIEGKVTIQFTVESSGSLSNFNVVKGIGYGCDDEVIRLIKEGPKWNPTKRDEEAVKGRIRVRMRFTLPKKK